MNEALLIDMFYAAPELWYTLGLGLAVLLFLMGAQGINILKLRQKNYFLNRDRERYAETLYASKDGYFAFIYPDEKVNDPCKTVKERCSRRLAVLMNLPGGTASVFEDILNRFTREDAGKIRKYVACLKEDGISFEDEFVLKNSNRHLNLSGSRINGQDGNVYCDMIWFRDVSRETNKIDYLEEEKKHTAMIEELTKKLQSQLELFTVSIPGGVKISNDDPEYSFKYVSEQFANMLGYATPKELLDASGGNIVGLAHPDDVEVGLADALNQYTHSDHYATIYRIRCKDGTYKYIEDRGQKVIKEDGTIEHWNLMLDKNDFMHKSIALESEKKANKSKSDFLSRMSHDMRTPLNGIIGLLKIAEKHFDDRELVLENFRKMQVAADYLLSLINDILQMSKIEEGNVPLTQEIINFEELSQDVLTIIEQRAKDRGIQMQFRSKKEGLRYPFIYGSPVHMRQIFLNIYGNCIKYNRIGGKIITVSDYTEAVDGITTYEWTITDTGIGMSREYQEHIFEPFSQERNDSGSTQQGIGLGMSIVKGLIEKMGGTIKIKSEEGIGSTFIIRISFKLASAPDTVKKTAAQMDISGLNLLLVEDNELNAEIAKTLLSDEGANLTVAEDGLQAVRMFQRNRKVILTQF